MKKVLLIFGVLSLLIFIRPALGLATETTSKSAVSTVSADQVDQPQQESVYEGAFKGIAKFYSYTGFANSTSGNIIMIIIGIVFIYLGIKYDYEPLLLIPIGTGVILGNIPFVAGNQTGI